MSSTARRTSVTLLHSLALAMLSCSLAFGQSFTASVRGTAKDPSGASIPRASVSITDADRGTSQTTLADEEGRFAITALPPGQYVLTVEAAGFKKFSSGTFTLAVQQQATVEARLEVGELERDRRGQRLGRAGEHDHRQPGPGHRQRDHRLAAQPRAKPDGLHLPHPGRRRLRGPAR